MTQSTKAPVVCGLMYVLLFFCLASVLRHQFGFPLDDSYIHQVIARNLAETHVLGFQPGVASSGSTSLVWTVILAAGHVLLPRVSPVWFCLVISACVLAAIGFLLMRLAQQDGLSGWAQWTIALAPPLSGNFLWFGLIGMEHLLVIALTLLLVENWLKSRPTRSAANPFLLCFLCFLLVLTRPDTIFLIVVILGCWRLADRPVKDVWFPGAGALCGLAVLFGWNWKISGQMTPPTMQGRQFLYGNGDGRLKNGGAFLWDTCHRMLKTWTIEWTKASFHGRGLLFPLSLLALGVLVLFAIRGLVGRHAWRWMVLSACALTLEAVYFVVLPATGHGGRYIALPLMMCMSLAFFGLHELLTAARLHRKLVGPVIAIAGLLTLVSSQRAWMQASEAEIEQINTEHGVMAEWMQDNLRPEAFAGLHLAVFDIGRIGYQFHGRIVDLGALVDSRFLPYLQNATTAVYLQQHAVQYVVLPMRDPNDHFASQRLSLDPQHGTRLTLVHTVCADQKTADLAWDASMTAFPCQYLYSVQYVTREAPNAEE
jgi:hypothetical protein